MKVRNITSSNGKEVPNQFIITDEGRGALGNFKLREIFQSYDSVIAVRIEWENRTEIRLDKKYWDFSKTTGKYRNQFLGENIADTRAKIKSGEYVLADLNRNL